MNTRFTLALAATVVVISVSTLPVSANSRAVTSFSPAQAQATAATEALPQCTNLILIAGVTSDMQSVQADLSDSASTGAGGVYDTMVKIANARIKYEDMPPPTDLGCSYLVTETIIAFADIQDLGLITMGTKLGLDTSADKPVVESRLQDQWTRVLGLIGNPPGVGKLYATGSDG